MGEDETVFDEFFQHAIRFRRAEVFRKDGF